MVQTGGQRCCCAAGVLPCMLSHTLSVPRTHTHILSLTHTLSHSLTRALSLSLTHALALHQWPSQVFSSISPLSCSIKTFSAQLAISCLDFESAGNACNECAFVPTPYLDTQFSTYEEPPLVVRCDRVCRGGRPLPVRSSVPCPPFQTTQIFLMS